MYKKLFSMLFVLGTMVLLASCEYHEYYDVHGIENGRIYCYSEGQKYYVDFGEFVLCSENLYHSDSITMDDAVATANNGFRIKRGDFIDVENLGNYELRKYHYNASFIIYLTSFAHETYYRYLPFEFEAKELWLNEKVVAQQPFIFERDGEKTKVTELPVSADDEGVYAKYLLEFFINVYNGYDSTRVGGFDYLYEVTRKDVSVWDGTDVTVTSVTYDWHPEN